MRVTLSIIISITLIVSAIFANNLIQTSSTDGDHGTKDEGASIITGQNGFIVKTEKIFDGSDIITGIDFLPDGRLLFTELHSDEIHVIKDGILQSTPYATIPGVFVNPAPTSFEERGVNAIRIHPNFDNGKAFVYIAYTFTENGFDGKDNRVIRYIDDGNGTMSKGIFDKVIIDGIDHAIGLNGGPMTFLTDGTMLVSTGSAGKDSLNLTSLVGKYLRLNDDGTVPIDNPFAGDPNVNKTKVYAFGLRNSYGIDLDRRTGNVIFMENGVDMNDEINILVAGGNYSWPLATGITSNPDDIDPIFVYEDSFGPTNMIFNQGDLYGPGEMDNFYFGGNTNRALTRVVLASPNFDRIKNETAIAIVSPDDSSPTPGTFDFPIALAQSPDGFLYVGTLDEIFKITSIGRDENGPDLEIVTAKLKSILTNGKRSGSLSIKVVNNSTVNIGKSFYISAYLSNDQTLSPDDKRLNSTLVNSISANQEVAVRITIPNIFTQTGKTLIVAVDSGLLTNKFGTDAIAERDESNNLFKIYL